MQTLIMIIMALVMVAMIMKLTFHRLPIIVLFAVVQLLFVSQAWPWAIEQSRTIVASSLTDGALMLDMAVLMSIDVAIGFAFCTIEVGTNRNKWWAVAIRFVPSLLVFPVLFATLVAVLFALPGTDFSTVAWILGTAVCALVVVLTLVMKWLLPEREIRTEMLFLVYMLIGLMGIIATVNGRTAVNGVNDFALKPLVFLLSLVATGALLGVVLEKIMLNKKLKNIR